MIVALLVILCLILAAASVLVFLVGADILPEDFAETLHGFYQERDER